MSAGQSYRRQSYHFGPMQTSAGTNSHSSPMHELRSLFTLVSVVALEAAIFVAVSLLFTAR